MCSFCVVPFTRGRERSRDPQTIIRECHELFDAGYREVTLLGQNVDSYRWNTTSKGEIKDETIPSTNFAELLEMVAKVSPDLRVRFSTSHPKDMDDEVLHIMARYENICPSIHLPVQSGNTNVLTRMNRGYSREWYLDRVKAIKTILPDCTISTDFIVGFCDETEEEHKDTLSLIDEVQFSFAFMYTYSERPKTLAERKYTDSVPEEVKSKRLTEIIEKQRNYSHEINKKQIGKTVKVLVENISKKSEEHMSGRDGRNTVVVFPKGNLTKGQYVLVKVEDCTSATLLGSVIEISKPHSN